MHYSCVFFLIFLYFVDNSYAEQSYAIKVDHSPSTKTTEENLIIEAYKKAHQAVLNVSARTAHTDFFRFQSEGTGSGVIIDKENAYVLTNQHVIEGGRNIIVTFSTGESYAVRIIGQDISNDLALLQIIDPPDNLTELKIASSDNLKVGQRVIAIGNPFGLNQTLTTGIISSLGRTIRARTGRLIEDIIQTDAAINPGNSGGPLLDTKGRIIGINTAIISQTGENAGIGFAVSSSQIVRALPQLVKYGRILRPKIGVVLRNTRNGPVIVHVEPDSPADKSGIIPARRKIQRGRIIGYIIDISNADFIKKINGIEVNTQNEFIDELDKVEPNESIKLHIQRGIGGEIIELEILPELA